MRSIFTIIKEIITWLIILAVFSSIGFATDNPRKGILLWALVSVVIFAIVFVIVKNTQKRQEKVSDSSRIFKKIFGVVLILFACLLPDLTLGKAGFSSAIQIIIFGLTLVWIAIALLGTYLINQYLLKGRSIFLAFIGYIVLIIDSALPGLVMMQYDSRYNAMGTAYYLTIALAILSWTGLSMLKSKEIV